MFSKTKTPKARSAASGELAKRAGETGVSPTQKIAGFSELEKTTQGLARSFVTQPSSPDRLLAQKKAREALDADGTDTKSFNAIFDKILGEGERTTRSLGRALKLSGNDPGLSAKGRDVLGRAQSDVESNLVAAASQHLQGEANVQTARISLLDNLTRAENETKRQALDVGRTVGAEMRQLEQMINDANFNRSMQEMQLRYQIQPGLLRDVIAANPTYTDAGFLGKVNELAGTVKNVAGAVAAVYSGGMSTAVTPGGPGESTSTVTDNQWFRG